MDERVVVNIDFEGDETIQNVLQIPYDITWADFELLVKLTFDVEELQFKYLDDENEEIIISSEEEFLEALRVAKKYNNTLHLKLKQVKPPPIDIVFEEAPEEDDLEVHIVEANKKSQTVTMSRINKPDVEIPIDVEDAHETEEEKKEHEEESMEHVEGASAADSVSASELPCPDDSDVIIVDGINGEPKNDSEQKSPKSFFIKSAESGMVVDVRAWGQTAGTPLILYTQKPSSEPRENQLFYEDYQNGAIRSCFNNLCIDVSGNHATLNRYNMGKTSQQWMTQDNKVHHRFNPNWVLTALDESASRSTGLHASEYNSKSNQHWIIEYVETNKHNLETGEKGDKANQGQNLFDNIAMMPPRPCKQRVKGYYSQLAREVGRLHSGGRMKSHHPRVRRQDQCNESGETARIDAGEEETPPAWFFNYMDKVFKAEITNEISKLVARKTVRQVLRGLEGAVVTSIHGTSGMPTVPPASGLSTIDQASTSDGQRNVYCHYGVVCDNCEQTIVGARFKCGNCEDYDLCEQCENVEGVHDPDHVFVKIRRPTITAGRRKNGKLSPLLKKSLYTTEEDRKRMEEKTKKEEKKQLEKRKKIERMERKEEHREEKQRRREEKLKRRLVEQRECPMKKERLDLPQFQTTERMDAEFINDANIPDATHVQPCTRLTKRWVMKNTGTHCWTSSTKLKLMWGNITCVADEVTVPYLEPGLQGTLAVELTAPEEPGVYQSHWRLHHHGTRFGHRVWCSIVVDPREILEPDQAEPRSLLEIKKELDVQQKVGEPPAGIGPDAAAAVAQLKCPTQDQTTKVVDADILTAQDILSFEMLDIHDRNTPKVSQTATPNNTPLAVSPPKSPAPELEEDTPQLISSSSSVELVSEASCEDLSAQMTELVQERIAALGLKHDGTDDEDDIETISSCSSEDNDTDSDFYIVPLPDCFNPNLPPSTSASTSVVIPKETQDKSLDEILTASNSIEMEPLIPSVKPSDVIVTTIHCADRADPEPDVVISEDLDEEEDTRFEDAEVGKEDECIDLTEEAQLNAEVSERVDEDTVTDHNANLQPAQDGEEDQAEPVQPIRPRLNRQQSPSPGEIAQSVLTTAIGVASHAAASAYSTAKDVFKTLQAKEQYMPPKSEWTPPSQDWTLPKQEWTPPSQDWTPPNIKWTPPKTTWVPPEEPEVVELDKPSTPMEQLVEMGFGNRAQNQTLLDKFDGDLPKVIQELIQMQDEDWHKNRH